MSALGGAVGIGLALIVEEVLVTSKGGPGAITGFFGSAAAVLDHLADPTYAAIPDLTKPSAPTQTPTTPALPGQKATPAPLQGKPGLPVRDYNPSSLAPGGLL